ncbi:MAG: hypothetical protein EBU01_13980 [Crocinitomicaceae bacterium]|nr:hypothetical protein [Crocinitomicaceae bacterium]
MFDLSVHSYDGVVLFLSKQMEKRKANPCVKIPQNIQHTTTLYELFIITMDYEYFDDPNKNKNVMFNKCHYYVLEYNDDAFYNELSVLDCGGYYIAICIFKNKQNITNEIIYNKMHNKNQDNYYTKFQMNTIVGNSNEIIPNTQK